jgi:hypothetical protein
VGTAQLEPKLSFSKSPSSRATWYTPSEREEGTKCCLLFVSPKDPVTNNTVWEIAAAGGTNGQPESGDREYHILSVSSGLYVTCLGESVFAVVYS